MSQSPPHGDRVIETVDLSHFDTRNGHRHLESERLRAGKFLVESLHSFGFVNITGHGLTEQEMKEALAWTRRLFDLPYEEKMKAPHPAGSMPHRGYSGIGKEKIYSHADIPAYGTDGDLGQDLRKISDFKESYEIGSELDPIQPNIWLPPDVFPNFRDYMTKLYGKLSSVSKLVLDAIGVVLGLEGEERDALTQLLSDRHCQLRLLHYPPCSKEQLRNKLLARLPAHTDWGTFTLLFQDKNGGLELKDRKTGEYLQAVPKEGALVLNAGDMLQRFTNDYIVSALHRVSVPEADTVPEAGIPARYSVPFFVPPDFSHTVSTLPRYITSERSSKYQPIRFDQYNSIASKYQYQGEDP